MTPSYQIRDLPPPIDLETKSILKAAAKAHRHLAELKGRASSIPNQSILIDTLSLQEAKASSEIENIVTTQDELFKSTIFPDGPGSAQAKEVMLYNDALKCGFKDMSRNGGLITNNSIIKMFQILKRNNGRFRKTPGTALKNEESGEIVYVPPQDGTEIQNLMSALETFINDDEKSDLDPLIKMALIHHQFESIHPFPDGNGRVGRILNVLYLTRIGLLDIPILYLSRAITQSKNDYYRLLQSVREDDEWEAWVIYMLEAISETSKSTLLLIEEIQALMAEYKIRMRNDLTKLYSQDLLNNLFRHPYTRIEFVQHDLGISRPTASRYLEKLLSEGFVEKYQSGRDNYYINRPLVDLFLTMSK